MTFSVLIPPTVSCTVHSLGMGCHMKNSSQTQHHRSETKKKEEQKIEEIAGCRMQAESMEQWNSSRRKNGTALEQ